MLMTRFLYVALVATLLVLDGVAVWHAGFQSLPAAALIVNAAVLPLALVIAYRLGQVIMVEKRRARRASAGRATRG
jgi:hypothetical protein